MRVIFLGFMALSEERGSIASDLLPKENPTVSMAHLGGEGRSGRKRDERDQIETASSVPRQCASRSVSRAHTVAGGQ